MESIFRVWSDSFDEGAMIPEGYAYAKLDPMGQSSDCMVKSARGHTVVGSHLPGSRRAAGFLYG